MQGSSFSDKIDMYLKRYLIFNLTILAPLIVFVIIRVGLEALSWYSPKLTAVLSAVITLGVMVAAAYLIRHRSLLETQPSRVILCLFIGLVTVSWATFSSLSFSLYTLGWVNYSSQAPITSGMLADYYAWHFFDMIPGLETWTILDVKEPVKASGHAAIITVIYRLSIVIPSLLFLKRWLAQV